MTNVELEYLKCEAEKGNAQMQFDLGFMYENGARP